MSTGSQPEEPAVRDNAEARRFELAAEGRIAFAEYNRLSSGIVLTHTEVPPELEGRGFASAIFRFVVARLRERGETVMPVCPVFALWLKKHAEAHDVVHPSYRSALGIPAA
ncbi:GNAT family N-acetyltransferase [Stella sp.]|uniref:GNAT family N-acetyltransferase n=1 Tax=Stella sp. TaxID=2912054 RepID=UPI0035B1DBFC